MSFCKFSSDYLMESFTLVDNLFINEYLPYADEKFCKVYLYGLYLCNAPSSKDNSLEGFSKTLDIEEDQLVNIFNYWQDEGLLEVCSTNPLEVRYLSLKGAKQPPKKYNTGKYSDFNTMAQQLFSTRQLVPNEYLEYYDAMETLKIQPDAMIMIIQYCINNKGATVRYPYITAVARSWAREGIHSVNDVEAKLNEFEALDGDMRAVMSALGRKGQTDLEEKQMLLKWTKNWGFDLPSVLFAAKTCKNKGGFKKLDTVLDEYYRMNIYTENEMKEYVKERDNMRELAIKINKTIGVFYESLDHIIETYVNPWLAKGFDDEALLTISKYCFVSNIRTLSGMNTLVIKFYKLGLVTTTSINEYIERQVQNDEIIKKILLASGTTRSVSANDRDLYHIWCVDWELSDELILYAAQLSSNSRFPMQFLNKQLSKWKEGKIRTVDEAKNAKLSVNNPTPSSSANFTEREYTKEQLNAIFANIHSTEIDI
ncbi:MAG: DnaD domain protein [Clostridia bacterium]